MRITLPSGTPAALAVPDGDATRGVVLAPDIGGLRPLFDELCERLARENGWAVCAPEPFPGRETMTIDERMAAVGQLNDDVQLGALVEAAAHLRGLEVDPLAVLGFCMGGMYALKASGIGQFDRAVAFYGMIRVPERWRSDTQGAPLDFVTRPGAAPVLAIIGTADSYTPSEDCDALEDTGATVVRYEGAEHGFVHDPSRPAHRATDAADAWRRVKAFLSV
ncbi:MAG: carboxymethylenebutenolidase [Actinomycetota bacterium]|nr:carboxymethylenebutenolidase [Actinomycetota bacterium]